MTSNRLVVELYSLVKLTYAFDFHLRLPEWQFGLVESEQRLAELCGKVKLSLKLWYQHDLVPTLIIYVYECV